MDLLVEKLDGSRYYLSQYKVLITEFEESAPSVTRNSKQLDQRNGNIDFGGWHTDKTINITGYYRADDIDEEELLREKLYALLSDTDGYYITQLKTTPSVAMERPGETSGGYYGKLKDYPSHKRFLVYTEAPEIELVGNVNGTLLYKLTAEFKTMKLPYGESVPRDLDVKPNVPYIGTNLTTNSNFSSGLAHWLVNLGDNKDSKAVVTTDSDGDTCVHITGTGNNCGLYQNPVSFNQNQVTTGSVLVKGTGTLSRVGLNGKSSSKFGTISTESYSKVGSKAQADSTKGAFCIYFNPVDGVLDVYVKFAKLELGSHATDWSPAPTDSGYNEWYLDTYYNTNNLVIPYAGTVPCNQLEQGFTIELTAKAAASSLSFKIDDTELTYSGAVASGDVFLFSGFSYTQNGLSIVSKTNKAYFILQPDKPNRITCNVPGTVRILGFQNLYA